MRVDTITTATAAVILLAVVQACYTSHDFPGPDQGGSDQPEQTGEPTNYPFIVADRDSESTGGSGGDDNWIPPPICGDGIINRPNEQCDGANLGGASCESLGEGSGTLSCFSQTCTFDVSMCYGVVDTGPTRTVRECNNLVAEIRNQIPYDVPLPVAECLCDNCPGDYANCLLDPGCLDIIVCCARAGYADMDCYNLPNGNPGPCYDIISSAMNNGVNAINLAMAVSECYLGYNCPPLPLQR